MVPKPNGFGTMRLSIKNVPGEAGERTLAPCRCGQVELEIVGAPILRGICYCASCQEAGRRYQATPGADFGLAEDGGTDYVLYRKDRARCVRGGDLLERIATARVHAPRWRIRLQPSAMFVDVTVGHWLTIYRGRLPNNIPPATMRLMTVERPKDVMLPDDMPNYPGRSGKFMLKLLRAWAAMGFRRPAIEGVP
jgi:hypothetical protein